MKPLFYTLAAFSLSVAVVACVHGDFEATKWASMNFLLFTILAKLEKLEAK